MNLINKESKVSILLIVVLIALLGLTLASVILSLFIGQSVVSFTPWGTFYYWQFIPESRLIGIGLSVGYIVASIFIIGLLLILFYPKKKLHGSYRFAKSNDIKTAGLFEHKSASILLGKYNNQYLYFSGQEFVMVYAPTRSGKGVSIVVPNLLQFTDSVVCLDIKFENYELTSGFRRHHGQEVFLFAPGSKTYKTHRWNPLSYISEDPYRRLNDIDKISGYLLPTPPNVDPMWTSEARELLKALILLVLDTPALPSTFGEVLRQLKTERPSQEYFADVIKFRGNELDSECVRGLSGFVQTPDKTAGGIRTTLLGALNPWSNPLIDSATSANDFDLYDLRKKKMTIYLGLSQDDLIAFSGIFNLFVQQLITVNTQTDDIVPRYSKEGELLAGNPDIRYQCLLLLDEFCSLGKMESFVKGVSFIAGYNLRLMPIFQSQAQLIDVYGEHAAANIMENHSVRIFFRPNQMKQAQELSNELGSTTAIQKSHTRQKSFSVNGSVNLSETKRALMLPEEIMKMKDDQKIILVRSSPYPILGKKIFYFKNKDFKDRLMPKVNVEQLSPVIFPVRGMSIPSMEEIAQKLGLGETASEEEIDAVKDEFAQIVEQCNESNRAMLVAEDE